MSLPKLWFIHEQGRGLAPDYSVPADPSLRDTDAEHLEETHPHSSCSNSSDECTERVEADPVEELEENREMYELVHREILLKRKNMQQ